MKRNIHTMVLPLVLTMALTGCATTEETDTEANKDEVTDTLVVESETPTPETESDNVAKEAKPKETVSKDTKDKNESISATRSKEEIKAMNDEKANPGTTKNGEIDDVDAVYNAINAYYDIATDPKGTRPKDKESKVFNYKALNDDDKYNIIATVLAAKLGTSFDDAPKYDVKINKKDIEIDNSGKLPKAFIPADKIILSFEDGEEMSLGENNIDDSFDGFRFVRYKGIWYVSKESVSPAPRAFMGMFGEMLGGEEVQENN